MGVWLVGGIEVDPFLFDGSPEVFYPDIDHAADLAVHTHLDSIACQLAIILASVVSVPLMIATGVICLIFPQLDGYLISPKVYGKTNNVNPLITIMAVSIGGTLAGVVGIVAALPCYLLIRTTYHFFKKDLKKGMDIVKETI